MGIKVTGGVKIPQGKFSVASNRAPTWTTGAGTIGTENEGTVVSFQFEASDPEQGTSGLIFSKISGDFPAGLNMDSAGLLSGTASDVESNTTSNFSIRVTDSGGLFEDRAFSMTIDDVFSANSVNFDGTNDYLFRTTMLSGLVDSKKGIFSCWLTRGTDNVQHQILAITFVVQDNPAFLIRVLSDNKLQILARNTGDQDILDKTPAGTFTVADSWVHFLISWDLGASAVKIYRDDVDVTPGGGTLIDDTIEYTRNASGIGHKWLSSSPGDEKYNGDMSEFYFQDGEFLDLTVTNNRRKFIDAGGKPVDLGSDGSIPTGSAPLIFLSGSTATWHTNKGSGGGFSEVGALTDGTLPVEV